jgi:hypothetical protein
MSRQHGGIPLPHKRLINVHANDPRYIQQQQINETMMLQGIISSLQSNQKILNTAITQNATSHAKILEQTTLLDQLDRARAETTANISSHATNQIAQNNAKVARKVGIEI